MAVVTAACACEDGFNGQWKPEKKPPQENNGNTDPDNPGTTDPSDPDNPGTDPNNPDNPGTDPNNPDNPGTDPNNPDNPGTDPNNPSNPSTFYSLFEISSQEDDLGVALAFPGAEGGGMYTSGGRGGKVIHVTNLKDYGTGSLRAAVEASGPRTVVFDVAGTIELTTPLIISNGDLTIAGQTAPGDGICIKGRYTQVKADNVIIRFVRFRLGDESATAGDGDDAIWGRYQKNIILDHCSMSWSIDECASFYANKNFTMQWCILAESLRFSSKHSKGGHGYGGIWGGENASFHHNILAHHDSRNPRIDHPHIYADHNTVPNRGVVDFRNNVIYNWGSNNTYGGEGYGAGKGTGVNMISNYYKNGSDSQDRKYFIDAYGVYASCNKCGSGINEGYPLLYITGNIHSKYSDISSNNASGIYWHSNKTDCANYQKTSSSPFIVKGPNGQSCYVSTHPANDALSKVCSYGGASLRRDAVDERTTKGVLNGTGKIVDCLKPATGKIDIQTLYGFTYPELKASQQELDLIKDTDSDGIPDWFEDQFGLNKNDANDSNSKTLDIKARYTNLEMYMHYLVKDIVKQQSSGGNYQAQ